MTRAFEEEKLRTALADFMDVCEHANKKGLALRLFAGCLFDQSEQRAVLKLKIQTWPNEEIFGSGNVREFDRVLKLEKGPF